MTHGGWDEAVTVMPLFFFEGIYIYIYLCIYRIFWDFNPPNEDPNSNQSKDHQRFRGIYIYTPWKSKAIQRIVHCNC